MVRRKSLQGTEAAEAMREAAARLLDEEQAEWPYGGEVSVVLARLAEVIRALPVDQEDD